MPRSACRRTARITLRVGGRPVDVRVSTLPTGHGERVVLRLLEKDLSKLELTNLGMAEGTLAGFDKLIHQPHGIILVTGPTGSGKSTTLYAAIRRLDKNTTNIMTVEDPIEYDIEGIGQTQVNAKIDMTFAKALRAILRQDPDIVMIGEIRDLETAQIAVQSSLTGHLVLATLHTNDAAIGSDAPDRYGHRALPAVVVAARRAGPAPGAQALPALQRARHDRRLDGARLAATTAAIPAISAAPASTSCSPSTMRFACWCIRARTTPTCAASAEKNGMINMRADAQRWIKTGVTSQEETLRVTRE